MLCTKVEYIRTKSIEMSNIFKRIRPFLSGHKMGRNLLLLIPGVAGLILTYTLMEKGSTWMQVAERASTIYVIVIVLMTANSLILSLFDIYSKSRRHKNHPMKGFVQATQVVLWFVGAIIVVAVLLGKSPKVLLTGLGASAAVLMLVFKDSILGFVAGIQLSQNNMVRIGDWIQLPDGSANGTVDEITLNTVKVRNWDNTITMIPPYTLVSSPFKNWRGMQESGGRRVSKKIFIDMKSIKVCSEALLDHIRKNVRMMDEWKGIGMINSGMEVNINYEGGAYDGSGVRQMPTNAQAYRAYIERYLRSHPIVAQELDLIIAQREPTQFGLPVEVYFFLSEKVWNEYEKIQSDIFDHLIAMVPEFGLELYQLPSQS